MSVAIIRTKNARNRSIVLDCVVCPLAITFILPPCATTYSLRHIHRGQSLPEPPNLLFSDYASMLRCRAWSEPMSQKDARHDGIRRIGTLLEDVEAAGSRRPPSSRPTAGSPRSSTQAGTRRRARRGTAASTSRSTERGGRT